jgi:hypothetical protein
MGELEVEPTARTATAGGAAGRSHRLSHRRVVRLPAAVGGHWHWHVVAVWGNGRMEVLSGGVGRLRCNGIGNAAIYNLEKIYKVINFKIYFKRNSFKKLLNHKFWSLIIIHKKKVNE